MMAVALGALRPDEPVLPRFCLLQAKKVVKKVVKKPVKKVVKKVVPKKKSGVG